MGKNRGYLWWGSLSTYGTGSLSNSLSCRYKIVLSFQVCGKDLSWVFTKVYGPNDNSRREDLWFEFGVLRGLWGTLGV